MQMLEKELRDMCVSLGEERVKREGKQNELAAALDKVKTYDVTGEKDVWMTLHLNKKWIDIERANGTKIS